MDAKRKYIRLVENVKSNLDKNAILLKKSESQLPENLTLAA